MKTNKAMILTWTGFQDQEVIYPYYRLLGAKFDTIIIADKKDNLGKVYGINGVGVPCSVVMSDFKKDIERYLSNYDLLILPGGVKSLEKLRQETQILSFISKWNKMGKVIASTCHGAQLLISSKVSHGRKISGYYSIEDDITNSGAIYLNMPVVIDDNIISSPHYDFMGEWMEETLRIFQEKNN